MTPIPNGFAPLFRSSPFLDLIGPLYSRGSAKLGDWLETSVDLQKSGSRLAFANCFIHARGERIVRASAVFLVVGDLGPARADPR
jgi:hypothetical protein